MKHTFILLADGYKLSHYQQLPPNTTKLYSYLEARGVESAYLVPKTVFFGLQYFLKEYFVGVKVTEYDLAKAIHVTQGYMDNCELNVDGWRYIIEEHGGMLPIEIKAVPEGTIVPYGNVLVTVENTDDKCAWLTNYCETVLLNVWGAITVASKSHTMVGSIEYFLKKTGASSAEASFRLHDFGARGVTCPESAAILGAAHLVTSTGTDTLAAMELICDYYNSIRVANSVPASEHSTITSWQPDREFDAYRNMLTKYPKGVVSIVSDSYDVENACENGYGGELKELVEKRDGVLTIRPDSGDPCIILVRLLNILGAKFGFTVNRQGFKVLNPKIKLLQGDGIKVKSLVKILQAIREAKWCTDCLIFGSGGGLLQDMTRDTYKFAFKCSWAWTDRGSTDVFKQPKTDSGKDSKRGRLKLLKEGLKYVTVPQSQDGKDQLVTVFRNGELLVDYTFEQVRENYQRCAAERYSELSYQYEN